MMPASRPLDWTSRPREAHWRHPILSDQIAMTQPAGNTQPRPDKIEASAHSSDSSLREQALGHLFLGQLLTFMWQSGARDIEVLKSEVDRGGYDVVLESNGVIRHISNSNRAFAARKSARSMSAPNFCASPAGASPCFHFTPEAPRSRFWVGGDGRAA